MAGSLTDGSLRQGVNPHLDLSRQLRQADITDPPEFRSVSRRCLPLLRLVWPKPPGLAGLLACWLAVMAAPVVLLPDCWDTASICPDSLFRLPDQTLPAIAHPPQAQKES
ncbi:hypothetical protein BKA56DRAFT_674600 [Ilyonectria sp. MPI-CAGE-AT-0026]|nr:hypothetical protein BKA56DRAFT_674600 [Ilyonectria sp. MPI-CAGE-AT-0026]